MSVVDEIKARIDIVDLIGETVELRRSGKNYVGFCPFHPNTRTPAFAVFPETGTWRCFGQCNTGGDIFTFVMKKEGWDFRQALQYLAERAGISLKEREGTQETSSLKQWRALLEEAVVFYRHHLHQPPGREALAYLEKRGLIAATLEAFGLGYAPRQWDALVRYFAGKGVPPTALAEVGLARIDEATGEARDYFHHRIMFPIRDGQGRPVGFGARTLDPDGVPKYLNSPTTPLFDKGRLLYGLDRASKAIRQKDRVVLVEGYMDVLALHQAGFEETVSAMGTSLTPHQLRRLKNLTRNLYLALDPDPAGQQALWRSLNVARETAAETQVTLDARGLLRYEQRLQLNLRVVVLPQGKDPDEIVLEDPALWTRLLDQARPLVLYLMDLMAQTLNLDDPKERARLAETMVPLIRLVDNPVEQEAYLRELAERVGVPVERLRAWYPSTPSRRAPRSRGAASRPSPGGALASPIYPVVNPRLQERFILAVLWHQPDLLAQVQRTLRERKQEPLSEKDFQEESHREAWRLLEDAHRQFGPMRSFLATQSQARGLDGLVQEFQELLNPLDRTEMRRSMASTTFLVREIVRMTSYLRIARITQAMHHLEQILRDHSPPYDVDVLARFQAFTQQRRRIEQVLAQSQTTGVVS